MVTERTIKCGGHLLYHFLWWSLPGFTSSHVFLCFSDVISRVLTVRSCCCCCLNPSFDSSAKTDCYCDYFRVVWLGWELCVTTFQTDQTQTDFLCFGSVVYFRTFSIAAKQRGRSVEIELAVPEFEGKVCCLQKTWHFAVSSTSRQAQEQKQATHHVTDKQRSQQHFHLYINTIKNNTTTVQTSKTIVVIIVQQFHEWVAQATDPSTQEESQGAREWTQLMLQTVEQDELYHCR